LEQAFDIRKPFSKYYIALVALAATFLAICILVAYFVHNDTLGLFGIFYIVILIFGMFLWKGTVQPGDSTWAWFIISTVVLFVISMFVGAVSKQWSFLATTKTPSWLLQTATPNSPLPTFFNIPVTDIVTTVLNVPGPVAEESFFRIFLWRMTSPALGKKKVLGGQAVIFGVFHYFAFGGSFAQMAVAIAAGLWLGFVYWKSNNELVIASSHLIYNLGALIISALQGGA
jgi:membrane protease YdiL (CAAX protease family)